MESTSCHQLLIALGVGTKTHTHIDVRTETILRNQVHASCRLARAWFKKLTNGLPHSRLFVRGKFFMNWSIPTFWRGNFTNCQKNLMINAFSKHNEDKIFTNCSWFMKFVKIFPLHNYHKNCYVVNWFSYHVKHHRISKPVRCLNIICYAWQQKFRYSLCLY